MAHERCGAGGIHPPIHPEPAGAGNPFCLAGRRADAAWRGLFPQGRRSAKKHAADKTIFNAIQTNGTLLDDEWCEFLAANQSAHGAGTTSINRNGDSQSAAQRQQTSQAEAQKTGGGRGIRNTCGRHVRHADVIQIARAVRSYVLECQMEQG